MSLSNDLIISIRVLLAALAAFACLACAMGGCQ